MKAKSTPVPPTLPVTRMPTGQLGGDSTQKPSATPFFGSTGSEITPETVNTVTGEKLPRILAPGGGVEGKVRGQ